MRTTLTKDDVQTQIELIESSLKYLHAQTPRVLEAIEELEKQRLQMESILYRMHNPLSKRTA
jgi:hypothetical protein